MRPHLSTAAPFGRPVARPFVEGLRRGSLAAALAALAPIGLLVSGAYANSTAAAAGSPITIAFISSLSGAAASQYQNSDVAFRARLDLQNAKGGVHGHQLVPLVIDDQTNPTTNQTAVQDAISKGALGIVANSPVFFSGAKFAQQAGVPVTGAYTDGPEWGEQPYTNMFASDRGSVDPKYPVNTGLGLFLKQHGGKVLATYGYGISPSSAASAVGNAKSFELAGGQAPVVDTSLPFGTVNFGTVALVAKQKNIDALVPSLDDNSNYALATALTQAGAKLKAVIFATGFEPSVISSPVWPTVQGYYFLAPFRPFSLPNAGTEQMGAALRKYAKFTKSQFPTFSQYEAWMGADLMIKGLQLAGPNPSHAAVIKDLRGLKSYNGNGLLPITINYSTIFGHDAPQCEWFVQAQKSGFVPVSAKPICGHDVVGTSTR
jgi:branched-chain amino acid transport system substrate-binding protein